MTDQKPKGSLKNAVEPRSNGVPTAIEQGERYVCISPPVQQALRKAGWSEERQIDVSAYAEELTVKGHAPPSVVMRFLQAFGGLVVDYGKDNLFEITFDAVQPGRALIAAAFSRNLRRPFYYLGSLDGMECLVMDSEGTVYIYVEYSSHDGGPNSLYRLASSGEEAIEAVFREGESGDQSGRVYVGDDYGVDISSGGPLYE